MAFLSYIPAYLVVVGLCALVITRAARLIRNYNFVKNQGWPVVIIPWSWQDPLWMLLSPYFLWLRHVPGFSWIRYSYMGWTTEDKARAHLAPPDGLGPAFIVVSPSRTEVFTIDTREAVNVSRNWREYEHPHDLYSVFGVFGESVLTTNGAKWQRHRKIVGGAFREAIYSTVWDESKTQAEGMLETFLQQKTCTLKDIRHGAELLAMHVLSAAAFGKKYAYGASGLKNVDSGHKVSYIDCMRIIHPNLMGIILFGGMKLPIPDWMIPNGLRRIKEAVGEFKLYLMEAAQREQRKGMDQQDKVPNLATLMVRANDIEKDQNLASGNMTGHLSDSELYGNMFGFNFAGFETTAMTLSFMIPYLATFPEAQEWAREEVDAVFGGGASLSYEEAYKKLPRVLALMYETLRLHSSVAQLPRQAPSSPTTLDLPSLNKTLNVPPKALISTPIVIFGYLPTDFNGPDPYAFGPQRFVTTTASGEETLRDETELALKEGWMPWATGPRNCPGKKFSQVEFVSIVSSLLLRTEVKVADWRGEGPVKARQRLNEALANTVFNLGLTIKRPDQVGVEFVPRR